MLELTTTEIVPLLALILATGVVAGLLAGLLGVGGGIVIVPILFLVLDYLGFPEASLMQIAVATSLATIVPTSISSARAHHAKGNVDVDLFKRWAPFVFAGALVGGLLSFVIGGVGLRLVFGLIALVVAVNMAVPGTVTLAAALPSSRAVQGAIATFIGGFSALMGIGGGTLSVPTLSLFSYPTHRAVGTASAFGFVIAVPALVGFIASGWDAAGRPPFSVGWVSLVAAGLIFPITTLVAPQGAKIAHALPAAKLKLAFAIFLGITAIRMLWSIL